MPEVFAGSSATATATATAEEDEEDEEEVPEMTPTLRAFSEIKLSSVDPSSTFQKSFRVHSEAPGVDGRWDC